MTLPEPDAVRVLGDWHGATAWGQTQIAKTGMVAKIPDAEGKTSVEGVWAAGDCVTGTKSVIAAIAAGRECASAIDRALAKLDDDISKAAVAARASLVRKRERLQSIFGAITPASPGAAR